jgi:MOSC domain-containing protein YiiM
MQTGIIKEIMIGQAKGRSRESIREGFFSVGFGLKGDIHGGPGDKQVLFFGVEGRDRLSESTEAGLCFKRFVPTLATKGIDLFKLPVGTRLKIGESIMEISRVGKKCYPECVLVKENTPCVMPREVVFARVLESGLVQVGNEIQMVEGIVPAV